MGWWTAGGDQDEVLGDDTTDLVVLHLVKLADDRRTQHKDAPTLQELLDSLAAVLSEKQEFPFEKLVARLGDGRVIETQGGHTREAGIVDEFRTTVDEVIAIYRQAFHRLPTMREILRTFSFVLAYKPGLYLSGAENLDIEDMGSV